MEAALIPRHLESVLAEALATARAVNLIGPRQVGKTTLVRDLLGAGRFITLDDQSTLSAMEVDPFGQIEALTAGLSGAPLIIDEAQRAKALPLAIKRIVDRRRERGQFLLTGSSNVFRTLEVTDSLAGRLRTVKLWPLTQSEIERRPPTAIPDWALSADPHLSDLPMPAFCDRAEAIDRLLAGGYPEPRNLPVRPRQAFYRDIVDSVVDRDVADILRIRKTGRLRRLILQLAGRTASELNASAMASTIGLSRPTMDSYLDVLIRLSMVLPLGAWASGESKREIRHPKLHFVDTGIAAALRRLTPQSFDADAQPAALGGLLETFVVNEVFRALPLQQTDIAAYHWRNRDGREIDLLLEGGGRLVAIEVKASSEATERDFRHLDWFADKGPGAGRSVTRLVFHLGERANSFGPRRFALPVSALWASA